MLRGPSYPQLDINLGMSFPRQKIRDAPNDMTFFTSTSEMAVHLGMTKFTLYIPRTRTFPAVDAFLVFWHGETAEVCYGV